MNNPNRPTPREALRPLASIPKKDGFILIGVRRDGSEAQLVVFVDPDDGQHKVPGYADLIGWRLA